MKITNISTTILRLQENYDVFALVRMDTDEGIVGWGEAQTGSAGVREAIEETKPYLIGQNPLNIRPLITSMLYGKDDPQNLRYGMGLTGYVAPFGAATMAVSAIDLCLLDLAGKALNTPAYNLLGGCYRDRIRLYVDLAHGHGDPNDPRAWRDRAQQAVGMGFTALKFDSDFAAPAYRKDYWNRTLSTEELNQITRRLTAVREGTGPDFDLIIDCHRRYNIPDAIRIAQALEPLKLLWIEDPVPANADAGAFLAIRDRISVPICTGETWYTLENARPFIDRKAVDVIHPDPLIIGGLVELQKTADYADVHLLPTAIHNTGTGLATMAAAHVAAACRNFVVCEYHFTDYPWVEEVVDTGHPLIEEGHIALSPDRPGLGVEIDEDVVREHMAPGERFLGE